jgi:hypothetical protein
VSGEQQRTDEKRGYDPDATILRLRADLAAAERALVEARADLAEACAYAKRVKAGPRPEQSDLGGTAGAVPAVEGDETA